VRSHIFFVSAISLTEARYWCFSNFSWFVTVRFFGYNGATVCNLIHRCLSAPKRKSSPLTPVLTTRIIRALPRHHCRISVVETQTCLQVFSLLSAYNTIHTTECAHFQWLRGNFISKLTTSHSANIRTLVSGLSKISFITKVLQMRCRKNEIEIFSFRGKFFSVKMSKKSRKAKRIF